NVTEPSTEAAPLLPSQEGQGASRAVESRRPGAYRAVPMRRREMLTALLGAPAALAACRRPPPEPAFGGRLLGQDAAAGHKVRDGYRPEPETFEEVGVLVVGAGAAGLSAAWKLARSGL